MVVGKGRVDVMAPAVLWDNSQHDNHCVIVIDIETLIVGCAPCNRVRSGAGLVNHWFFILGKHCVGYSCFGFSMIGKLATIKNFAGHCCALVVFTCDSSAQFWSCIMHMRVLGFAVLGGYLHVTSCMYSWLSQKEQISLQRRINPHELDNEALAFKAVLGPMLARIYHNPQNKEENQSRLQNIVQFWGSKEVYDQDTICALENEMMNGLPANFAGPRRELLSADPAAAAAAAAAAGLSHQVAHQTSLQWKPDEQVYPIPNLANQDKPVAPIPSVAPQQFHPGVIPPTRFPGSMSVPSSVPQGNVQAAAHPMPTSSANAGGKLPPYPLFPPGLIPGMVRKMQIGSGVPYSPMSPLDIPTIIPPSTVSESEILERVSKFFREIGEVNPSEGPVKPSDSANDYDDYEREAPVRKGGACIPPPPNLQVDPETGTYPDGSVEQKPGLNSSGRLGLGATADPNESSQYDDVYSSYRKERSTNYHSSMSVKSYEVNGSSL